MGAMTSTNNPVRRLIPCLGTVLILVICITRPALAGPDLDAILPLQVSTVPGNGDLNPYGLAVVPDQFPGHTLHKGQLLVSNFNDSNNFFSGKGSTIIFVDPTSGKTGVFFPGTPPIGFTNALAVAEAGFVFAGSVFTTDGVNGQPGPEGRCQSIFLRGRCPVELVDHAALPQIEGPHRGQASFEP
ncbi:MAG TPA: hypothetical protein VMS64_33395 [Candidatus Methylomirabilis sp.]|nr:hypothetical protein [Candidatus Methylomirabilis sp.]